MRIGTSLGSSLVTAVVGLALAAPAGAASTQTSAHPRGTLTPLAKTTKAVPSRAQARGLHLKASRTQVHAGGRVGLRVINKSKARRTILVQRWDPKKRVWRKVAKRKVATTRSVVAKVPTGRWRYRAVSPRTKTGRGRSARILPAARSKIVTLTAKPRPATKDAPRRTATAGSVPVGSATYTVPPDALYVAPRGAAIGSGTIDDPYGTLTHAVNRSRPGDTIVMRAGVYHESVVIPTNKSVTIQNYPGSAVWLDGSSVISDFRKSGNVWVHSGWTKEFDHSPTYAKGAPDGTEPGWIWINPKYPLAAHPEQVWFGDKKLTQVGRRSDVVPGTFYIDDAADEVVVGSDPNGSIVRSSDLELGLTVVGPDSTVRGIGIRRYGTPVHEMGTLRIAAKDVTVENVVVADNATQGVTGWASGTTLRQVSSLRNGLTGFHANRSDNYTAHRILAEGNNSQHFNVTPVSAGLKMSASRGIRITDSVFRGNDGTGLWFDVSDADVVATGNTITGNTDDGLIFELSSGLFAANNVIAGNGSQSFFVIDSDKVRFWNNTITGSQVPIRIADTDRLSSDPAIPWRLDQIDIRNNIVSSPVRGNNWCGMLCVLDHQNKRTAEQMRITFDGNLYHRARADLPTDLTRWSNGKSGTRSFTSLAQFRSATRQENSGVEIVGAMPATLPRVGVGIPDDVAKLVGVPEGSAFVGAR